jgi:arabinofuranan 3-O-arabinosyltransferase
MDDGLRAALDGPLAPLRNTHKFELVIRIPLTIGLAHAFARGAELVTSLSNGRRLPRAAFSLLIPSLIVVIAAPGIAGSMARAEGYSQIPSHWREAAAWLDKQPRTGSVYITPAASFSDLTWGSTKDEPLQALMKRPFVVRDAVPLGSAGATRLLDSIEDRLSEGQRIEGLPSVLARSGIAFVLVRNELRLDAQGSPPPVVTRALEESGLSKVAGFGPLAGAYGESATLTVDYRTLIQRDAIEIYAVEAPVQARLVRSADLASLAGGPENLLQASGPLDARDVVTGTDTVGPRGAGSGTTAVLTDGRRHREVNFGKPAKQLSGLLEAADRGRSGRTVIDYESDPGADRTALEWQGVRSVTASSSASDAIATLRTGPANGPQAAFDGDPRTRWISGAYGRAVGEWLQVDFSGPTRVVGTTVQFSAAAPVVGAPLAVRVQTETGVTTAKVFAGPGLRLPTPPGATTWMRLTLVGAEAPVQSGFSIAEVSVPGVAARPTARLPAVPSAPAAVLLEEGVRGRTECLGLMNRTWCSPTFGLPAEEDGLRRAWTAGAAGSFDVSGSVRPVDGQALERLLALPGGWRATASSRLVGAPAGRPDAGIDADPATGWVAAPQDPAPWYEISLPRRRVISGLRVIKAYELPASTPVVVRVRFSDGTKVTARADASGEITFPPTRTSSLRLSFGEVRLLENIDSRTGHRSFAPVGFSELLVHGAESNRIALDRHLETGVPCGFGPSLTVNGRVLQTSVSGTIDDILTGRSLDWRVCSNGAKLRLPAGDVTLEGAPSGEFVPQRLDLVASGGTPAAAPLRLDLTRSSPAALMASVPERHDESVVVISQNFNAGWKARDASGHELAAVRVNGWQQGWILPAGGGTRVIAEFVPDDIYRIGLLVGLVLLLLVVAVARRADRGAPPRGATGGTEQPRVTRVAVVVAASALITVVGGWPGSFGVLMALALASSMRGVTWFWWRAVVVLTATTSAAVAVALRPWPTYQVGTSSWPVQALVWLAVSVAVVSLAERGVDHRLTSRMRGRSTT